MFSRRLNYNSIIGYIFKMEHWYIKRNGKQVVKQTISELNKANVNGWETAKSDFLALST